MTTVSDEPTPTIEPIERYLVHIEARAALRGWRREAIEAALAATPDGDPRCLHLRLALASHLRETGPFDRLMAVLDAGRSRAGDDALRALFDVLRAQAMWVWDQPAAAATVLRGVLDAPGTRATHAVARAFLAVLGVDRPSEGEVTARLDALGSTPWLVAHLYHCYGFSLLARGEWGAARRLCTAGLSYARRHRVTPAEPGLLGHLGAAHSGAGRFSAAAAAYEDARDRFAALGADRSSLLTEGRAAEASAQFALAPGLIDRFAEIRRALEAQGVGGFAAPAAICEAACLIALGRLGPAQRLLVEARVHVTGQRRVQMRARAEALLGIVAFARGADDEARRWLRGAVDVSRLPGEAALLAFWSALPDAMRGLRPADPDGVAPLTALMIEWWATPLPDVSERVVARLRHIARDPHAFAATHALRPLDLRLTVEALVARIEARPPDGGAAWLVDRAGRWLRSPAGEVVDLRPKQHLARLLAALVEAHVRARGPAASEAALIEAGWPAQSIRPDAARRRLQVAISTLRGAGLPIERAEGGYRLPADLPLHRHLGPM